MEKYFSAILHGWLIYLSDISILPLYTRDAHHTKFNRIRSFFSSTSHAILFAGIGDRTYLYLGLLLGIYTVKSGIDEIRTPIITFERHENYTLDYL